MFGLSHDHESPKTGLCLFFFFDWLLPWYSAEQFRSNKHAMQTRPYKEIACYKNFYSVV